MISIVVPCFNEEGNVMALYFKLKKVLTNESYEIVFVDDGSMDMTLAVIKKIAKTDKNCKYISFSRNFGHQAALKSGFDYAIGDCVITIDADLQHPPSLIPKMIALWHKGFDVVVTVRKNKDLPWGKETTSRFFYWLINNLSDISIKDGTADFRLMDKKVINVFKNLNESVLFLRGLISWMGFSQTYIDYSPGKRYSGKTKYSVKKMFQLAVDGITSFSIRPLRLSTFVGLFFALFSGVYALFAIVSYLFNRNVISGWASVIISIMFVGGIQLLMLGVIGEYLGKLFIESKKRPVYLISETNCEK